MTTDRITPCLWFEDQAEDAAAYYTSVFSRASKYMDDPPDQ